LPFLKDSLIIVRFIVNKIVQTCFFYYNVITDLSLKARKIRLPAKVSIDFRKNKNGVTFVSLEEEKTNSMGGGVS
jgi:hypothetical protein